MINVVILVGRLTKDAELQMTGSGKKLCRFTLACNKPQGCDFVPCTAFDKTAEVLATYGKKGKQIGLEGRLSVEQKENRTYFNVIAKNITLLDSKPKEETEDEWAERLPF